jgi:DNA-binding transcriptional ArsR family regulator
VSFETLVWVRTQKTGNPISRSVLRVLADHAGQDHSCYLRTRTISAETEASESAVRKALSALIDQGLVRVYERYDSNGARRSNRYQILIDGATTPPPDAEDWAGVREAPGDGGGAPEAGETPLSTVEGFPIKEATVSEAPVKGGASRPKIATRIPDDFQPTPEMREWFAANNLSAVIDGKLEHEKFMDYWRATGGMRGRKLDWPATWRNWMRTAAERAPRRPGNALAPISGVPYSTTSKTNLRVVEGLALVEKFEQMEKNK